MTMTDLKYKLDQGYIHNWLVAGPLESPIKDIPSDLNNQAKLELVKQYTNPQLDVTVTPVDLGSLGQITQQNPLLTWQYYSCREDHFIDFHKNYASCQLVRSWAYAQVNVRTEGEIKIVLTSNAPTSLWVNGRLNDRIDNFLSTTGKSYQLTVPVHSGLNDIIFRLENVGVRETVSILAVQLQDIADNDVEIVIPTTIEPLLKSTRENAELVIDQAYLDRYVYGNLWGDRYNRNQPIPLQFSTDKDYYGELTVRLQSLKGDIFQEGTKKFGPGAGHEFAKIFPLRNGIHHISITPPANDYYVRKIRVDRKEIFYVVRTPYSESSYGTFPQRAQEALVDAAQRRNDSIYCEIAKIASGQPETIERKIFTNVCTAIERHENGSVHDLLGILGLLFRYRRSKKIHRTAPQKGL